MMAGKDRSRNLAPFAIGGLLILFIVWGVWAWSNWGETLEGVDDSPEAVMPTGGAAPGEQPTPLTVAPRADTGRANPDNSGRDATGNAYTGARANRPKPAAQPQP